MYRYRLLYVWLCNGICEKRSWIVHSFIHYVSSNSFVIQWTSFCQNDRNSAMMHLHIICSKYLTFSFIICASNEYFDFVSFLCFQVSVDSWQFPEWIPVAFLATFQERFAIAIFLELREKDWFTSAIWFHAQGKTRIQTLGFAPGTLPLY